jgi:predicted O-methyltransferase YrrM
MRGRKAYTIEVDRCLWMESFRPPWRDGEQVLISAVGPGEWLQPVIERLCECSPGTRFTVLADANSLEIPARSLHPGYGQELADQSYSVVLFLTSNEEHPLHRNALYFLSHRMRFRRAYLCESHFYLLDLTRHTRTPKVRGKSFRTFSWVEPTTWSYLYRAARDAAGEGVVVEIGSYVGGTTLALAQGCRDGDHGPTVAVDHCFCEAFTANLAAAGLNDMVVPWQVSSQAAARQWPEWADEHDLSPRIRLLLLDGDHSYEAVLEDLERWRRFIDEDGLLVIHDYYNPFQPGVARACRTLLAPDSSWRITKKLADGIVCSRG